MNVLLRSVRLLAVVVWVGGLVLFAFALAPVAFHVLPVHEAGLVVGGTLKVLHPIGLTCGVLFLLSTSVVLARTEVGFHRPLLGEIALVTAMLLATFYLHRAVLPEMDQDQLRAGGDVNAVDRHTPARVDFDQLHRLSERVEGGVLLCGLAVVGLLAADKA